MTVLTKPPQDAATTTRYQIRLLAHQEFLQVKIINLTAQQVGITIAIATNPQDRAALREKMEIEDNLSKVQFDLTEEIEVVLTMDEKAEQSNIYRTYQEDEQRLITNCGKVYTLTLGQSTQDLKDKLKEGNYWEDIAAKYDPIQLIILPMVQWIQSSY
jgi:hypothetical protein